MRFSFTSAVEFSKIKVADANAAAAQKKRHQNFASDSTAGPWL